MACDTLTAAVPALTVTSPPAEPLRLLILISSLEHGGAENQVVELMRHIDRRRFAPLVCTLSDHVPLAARLPDPRELLILPKRWRFDAGLVWRVARLMRARGIQIVHNFLFDAEIVGRLAARLAGVPVVIASERNADYSRPWHQGLAVWATRGCFDLMIANSRAGLDFNVRTVGIAADRIRVVHNGVNTERFRPTDPSAVRSTLGLPAGARLVGMVASFKRQKNHGDFFRMAARVLERHPQTYFACVGEPLRDNQQGAADYHAQMHALVAELRLTARVLLLGKRDDLPAVYSACDLTVLPSCREGTPNVLLESMACGVPVVATEIADNAAIVPDGRAGFIVPLGDVAALAERVERLLSDDALRRRLGQAARSWVAREFSCAALARKTEAVYEEAARARSLLRTAAPPENAR